MTMSTKTLSSTLIATIFICIFASHANAACLSLSSDLEQGDQDTSSSGAVTLLQTYLATWGYLSVTPTGYFGPATFQAVQDYQTVHKINPTGYVGPLTRAALQAASCAATTPVATAPVTTTTSVVSAPVVTSAPVAPIPASTPQSVSSIIVTAPSAGQTLTAGQNYTIEWTGKNNASYNILLEDQNGIGKGFIATNLYETNSYVWNAGSVTSSANDSSWDPPLPTGTYRIHVENATAGPQSTDQPSATFSLVATPLAITSISPSYAPSNQSAANPTAVTLYGSGFDRTTMVTLQGEFTSSIYPTYIFPEGNELIFNVPEGLTPGKYSLGLSNTYGSFSSSAISLTISD